MKPNTTTAAFMLSPAYAVRESLKPRPTMGINGTVEMETDPVLLAAGVAILCIVGALGYQAGSAMAPDRRDEKLWGWIGVPLGMFTGTIGLGIMGAASNMKRGR